LDPLAKMPRSTRARGGAACPTKVDKILMGTIKETDSPVVIDDDNADSDSTKKLHQCQGAVFGH
jgi:hypothetical protein